MTGRADGFLLVDKPAGVTSFRVVDCVRKALLKADPGLQPGRRGRRGGPRPPRFKCGHAGTLDPLATGLLVVMTGKGSRLGPFLTGLDKTYAATVRFGAETDTHDADGQFTRAAPGPDDPATIDAVLDRFRGEILQAPPLVSALKRDGKALHARVRAGEDLAEPGPRPVRIDRLEVTARRWAADPGGVRELDLLVACGSGTYVRALARDLGRAVGSAAHLTVLRRLTVGPFSVDDALDGVLEADGAAILAALRPLADALPDAPAVPLAADEVILVANGGQPDPAWLTRAGESAPGIGALLRLVGPDGGLVAVARLTDEGPRIAAVLAAANSAGEPSPCE